MVELPTREDVVLTADEYFVRYEEQIAESLTLVMLEASDIAMQLSGGSVAFVVVLIVVYLVAHRMLCVVNRPPSA